MAADAECQVSAEPPAEGTFEIVVVERGDSLGTIAKHHLGDPKRWKEVYGANRDKLADPDRIYCGMTLRVPKGTC
jgi:nucleoid-associated protein YgaU